MAADLIRAMQSMFLPAAESCSEATWCPPADVYRTREGWLVKFDLAGVRPQDVQVCVAGRCLSVRGTRRDCSTTEGCSLYRMEIAYNHFQRSLDLPCDLDRARIHTEYRDGMLLVRIDTEPNDP